MTEQMYCTQCGHDPLLQADNDKRYNETIIALRAELAQARTILERLASITSNSGAMFFNENMEDDWDASLDWIEKHLSYTPEQSERERQREVINGWRLKVKDTEAELAQAREALRQIVNLKPEENNDTLQAIRHIGKLVSIADAALGKQEG